MQWPFSNVAGVGAAIFVAAVVLVALLTTGIGPIVLAALIVGLALYAAYVVLINVHRWATTRYDRRGRGP